MINQVRRFNRAVTQRAGALSDAFLARGRPLGQARLLWEIGPDGRDVRDLRARLDLDSGYLSRLLRALERDGMVTVEVNEADGRLRTARLTAAGAAERAELDRRSDEAAAASLGPLSERQRGRLSPPWPTWSGCWPPRPSSSACATRGTRTPGAACGPTSRSCPGASTAASTRPGASPPPTRR